MSFLITAYPNNLLCFRVENLSTALTVVLAQFENLGELVKMAIFDA